MNQSCILENSVNIDNSTGCSCQRGYYGEYCQNHYEWYGPVMIATYMVLMVTMIVSILWSGFRIRKFSECRLNVMFIAMILNIIACSLRIVYLVLPTRAVYGAIESNAVTLSSTFLVYASISLWLAATLLVIGFWHDALCNGMNTVLTTHTRTMVITTSTIVFIFMVVGMIFILSGSLIVGLLIVLVPLVITIIVLIVYSVKINRIKDVVGANNKKKRWASLIFNLLNGTWILYIVSLMITPAFNSDSVAAYSIIPSILYRLCEGVISILLMLLFDHRARVLRSLMCRSTQGSNSETVTRSTTQTKD